ncbi:MAG: hypothetical protein ACYCUI_10205 [Vulcanimicrobiaceae bacterium]
MTHTNLDPSCILAAAAFVSAFLALRHLDDPDRRRLRWRYASALVRDGGVAFLFAAPAVLYACVIPLAAGSALVGLSLLVWVVVSPYLSRRASQEGKAHIEAIMSGK